MTIPFHRTPVAQPGRPLGAAARKIVPWAAALGLLAALVAVPASRASPLQADPTLAAPHQPGWAQWLQAELSVLAARHTPALGVYVRDLDTGITVSHQAHERWYLASAIKVPVAMAVLRAVERGDFTLATRLRLRASDYVDGAGPTNSRPVGASMSVRHLLEQMIIHSDNTASDMLIGLVGLRAVNALIEELVPTGLERVTTLADVRRLAYAHLTPKAVHLTGPDFLMLKQQRTDAERVQTLARLLRVPATSLHGMSVGDAFEAYYREGLNSGRLDAYGDLLQQLVAGRALNPEHTAYLLGVMERVQTGSQRIKAGLPVTARFAHKTGTQRARTCDAGMISMPRPGGDHRVIVVACTRGELQVARSDSALKDVGAAICKSGLLTGGRLHDPVCLVGAPAVLRPDLDDGR